MPTIVRDLPPEEETPEVEKEDSRKFFSPSLEDDEALARRLQAEWDANDAAAAAAPTHTPASTTSDSNNGPRNANENQSNSAAQSVATVSNAWEFDVYQHRCTSCNDEFNPFNRRHHCRLCGKIFCDKCSNHRTLIPPSAIVLTPAKGGKRAQPPGPSGATLSFSPDPDPDRMLTYIDEEKQLLYGKGLEERLVCCENEEEPLTPSRTLSQVLII